MKQSYVMGGGGGRVLTGLHGQAGGAHLLVMDEVFALGEVNCAASPDISRKSGK
jgi:hypothetical protein